MKQLETSPARTGRSVQHAEKWQEADYCKSGMKEEVVEQMLINVGGKSSSEDKYGFQTENEDEGNSS